MFVDLLNSQNYIMVNMDAIRIFGLSSAVYCSELLNVYKKAKLKDKLINGDYFKVDREFIRNRTSLDTKTQVSCDINLEKVGVIKKDPNDSTILKFDIELFASLIASEDVKLVEKVAEKVQVNNPKGANKESSKYIIDNLKAQIKSKDFNLMVAMRDWIDTIAAKNGYLSSAQLSLFQSKLGDYCKGDFNLAVDVVNRAITRGYLDCQWAINDLEKEKNYKSNSQYANNASTTRVTQQRTATKEDVDTSETF